jgi:hypothetical protein
MDLKKIFISWLFILFLSPFSGNSDPFSFAVTCDMRNFSGQGLYDTPNYFRGVCETIAYLGPGAFMIVPGDLDPTVNVNWTIEQYLGSGYMWYPVVGNHELPGDGSESYYGANMDWLRSYNYDQNGSGVPPDIVNTGPAGCEETTYSFDYENAHFTVLNQYYDGSSDVGTNGDVVDALYYWLVTDLTATTQQYIFVIGHEPAYPQPDEYNGRLRHEFDSLNEHPQNRDRFWNLLSSIGITAYICGHTHNYSAVQINGVWQVDAGHARGAGDTGAPSTFLLIHVNENIVTMNTYRDIHDGNYDYDDIIGDVALPVKLSSFSVSQVGKNVKLEWITESEISNLGFIIERKEKEAKTWREIASYATHKELKGQGSVSCQTIYIFYDTSCQTGLTYHYRLANVSYRGEIEYHDIREITVKPDNQLNLSNRFFLEPAYPNPFNQEISILYSLSEESEVNLNIIDARGRIVKHLLKNKKQSINNYTVRWDGTNDKNVDVSGGVYFTVVNVKGLVDSQKIIFLR